MRHEALDERRRDGLHDVDAFRGRADLAVVEETGPRRTGHSDVEVGILEDNPWIDPAELEVRPLELRGRTLGDSGPYRRRSCERNAGDLRILDQRGSCRGAA